MAKPSRKTGDPSPSQREINHRQAAQLSALRALARVASSDSPSRFQELAEDFLEYVLQIFQADGGSLEISFPSSAEKLRFAIGSCRIGAPGGEKFFWHKMREPTLIQEAARAVGIDSLKKGGWDPKTRSLIYLPIRNLNRTLGTLVLGKSASTSFFTEEDLQELNLFVHYLGLAFEKGLTKENAGEAIRSFAEILDDGIYVIDRNGRMNVVNPKGMALLGITREQEAIRGLYEDPLFLNVHSPDGTPLSADQLPLGRVLRGETLSSAEYVIRRPHQMSDAHLVISGSPLRNEHGVVLQGILVAHEVTESRRQTRSLQKELAEEIEKKQAQTAFFNHISHELKTPLNSIFGYTSLLLKGTYGPIPEKAREAISRAHRSAEDLTQMINDLLTLARTSAQKMTLYVEKVDLGVMLGDISIDMLSLLKDKPVEVFVKIDPSLPLIESDPAKLKEIFVNLFSNATKYTHRGFIQIIAKNIPQEEQIRIEVVDSGIGIPKEDLPYLFEEFRRAEDPAIKAIPGTGLGLAIVKKMADLLQGSVEVKSVYGKGSTFTIFLPYAVQTDLQR